MKSEKNKVAFSSMVAAVFLTTFKLIVGMLTGSLGILSEALHSALDLVAAIITWFSVRISDKPADKVHQYGHGKVENLSALIETILLLITSIWIIYEAMDRLISGNSHFDVSVWAYVVVISSIIIDFSRSRALKRVAKKYDSQALEADALHFATDIWSSMVVLFGLVASNFGFFMADSIAALIVALIVIFVSYRMGKKAIDVLLDAAPKGVHDKITSYLRNNDVVLNFHDLRIRTSGSETLVDITVHLDPKLNLIEAHAITTTLEDEICKIISKGKIMIHAEPEGMD